MEDIYYDYRTGIYTNYDYYDEELVVGDIPFNPLADTYTTCVVPSSVTILWQMATMIAWCLCCRAGWLLSSKFEFFDDTLRHIISILTGTILLLITSGFNSVIIAALVLGIYTVMLLLEYIQVTKRMMGMIVVALTIASHLGYELLLSQPLMYEGIRGPIMVANMKLISLAFERDSIGPHNGKAEISLPTVIPFLGYMLAPAGILMGPWVPFKSYKQSLHLPSLNRRQRYQWVIWCILCSALALIFLNFSNCFAPLLCSDHAPIWFNIYRDAFAVRCSHYFVSFLSQALMAANGISRSSEAKPNPWLGHMVCRPLKVELPRSLNSSVRSWNIPMHDFLKYYIFSGTFKRFGSYALAILTTYVISALLHGYNLKIYLVLLSLPCFAYVEVVFRNKLAMVFDACITSNPCQNPCRFKYCSNRGLRKYGTFYVMLVNFTFGLLCTFHLSYLGVMMNDSGAESDAFHPVSTVFGLVTWSKVNYLNHWIVLAIFVLHLAV